MLASPWMLKYVTVSAQIGTRHVHVLLCHKISFIRSVLKRNIVAGRYLMSLSQNVEFSV